MNYAQRRRKLLRKLKPVGAEAILVTDIINVRYLTGFTGSSAYLLLGSEHQRLLSDTRYQTQLADECPDLEVVIRTASSTMLDSVHDVVGECRINNLAVETHRLVKSEYDQLQSRLAGATLIATTGLVEQLRAIKDKLEIEAIRRSISINQRSFEVIRAQLTPDQTERQIAHNLEHQMRAFGADKCAFEPIVGVGPRAALPHGVPGMTRVCEAPFVLMDWGANVDGYLSDLTRVLVTGKINAQFRKVYQTVLAAQLAAIDVSAPGVELRKVDRAARKVIEDAGFGKYFGHGTGHAFGLQIHEQPYLSPIHDGVLEPGMVVTVEPGIYLPGKIGVRIEDDVLVTRQGREILSDLPKELELCTCHLGD